MTMNSPESNTYNKKEFIMGFTNENHSEELLYKSHSLGITDRLWEVVGELRDEDPHLTIHEVNPKGILHLLTNLFLHIYSIWS